jgi:hypothetical protein
MAWAPRFGNPAHGVPAVVQDILARSTIAEWHSRHSQRWDTLPHLVANGFWVVDEHGLHLTNMMDVSISIAYDCNHSVA